MVLKLGPSVLRRLVEEEAQRLSEAVDHGSIRDIVTVASKLLSAVEGFKEKAPPAAMNAVTPHISEMERVLEDMVSSPGSYVAKPRVEPKRVTLKAVQKEGAGDDLDQNASDDAGGQTYRNPRDEDPEPSDAAEYEAYVNAGRSCEYCGSQRTEQLEPIPSMAGCGEDVGVTCLDCKRTSWASDPKSPYRDSIREATGGDGEFERVDGTNWQHLEVGNHYDCKEGRRSVASVSVFVGWVEPDTRQMTDSEDPEQVNLLFSDVSDGMEWEAYWFEGTYCVGSSADPLYVKEED